MDNLKTAGEYGSEEVRVLQRAENARTRQTVMAAVIGNFIGWAIGAAQLAYIGSADLLNWPFVSLIPLYSGLGWALFGMIIGGSGVFSTRIEKDETVGATRHAAA
jgi:hypothetical protein